MKKKLISIICILLTVMFIFTGCSNSYHACISLLSGSNYRMAFYFSVPSESFNKNKDITFTLRYGHNVDSPELIEKYTNSDWKCIIEFHLGLYTYNYTNLDLKSETIIFSKELESNFMINPANLYRVRTDLRYNKNDFKQKIEMNFNFSDFSEGKGQIVFYAIETFISDDLSLIENKYYLFLHFLIKGDKITFNVFYDFLP